jgi:hypothetical protein
VRSQRLSIKEGYECSAVGGMAERVEEEDDVVEGFER